MRQLEERDDTEAYLGFNATAATFERDTEMKDVEGSMLLWQTSIRYISPLQFAIFPQDFIFGPF